MLQAGQGLAVATAVCCIAWFEFTDWESDKQVLMNVACDNRYVPADDRTHLSVCFNRVSLHCQSLAPGLLLDDLDYCGA